ncbi:hypothetical protein K431DRAFT_288397 [Polychaeton citri CBS 116435]|uniref:Uncharacterized protein n=1 Tax=Polychaeton citri CBS 116435 TaxID=1314669 RepID=A0A9P4Q180_9PEZI|nr:hypothetical protein K431DRAFT_288397 [Polychaeton citri CBS 116435]
MGPVELLRPVVLDPIALSGFIEYVLYNHNGPSSLVVCGTRDAFSEQLTEALLDTPTKTSGVEELEGQDVGSNEVPPKPKNTLLSAPTLRFLANCRTLKLAFCPDVTHLRAYLSKLSITDQSEGDSDPQCSSNDVRLLALLNPIALHEPTSSFSVQGLNRTFSVAIDTAYQVGAKLVIGECAAAPTRDRSLLDPDPQPSDFHENDENVPGEPSETVSPWDQQVSILNVTTKSFGAGDRGWVGRTVGLRTIAERWCTFKSLSTPH